MANNPIDDALSAVPSSSGSTAPAAPSVHTSSNPIDDALGGSPAAAASTAVAAPTASAGNPIDDALGGGSGTSSSPSNASYGDRLGQIWNNSSNSFATKLWDTANAPVIDSSDLQRWIDPDAGGFVRGVFSLAAGLSSPLSVALTVGTWGAAGLAESGGVAALKAAGMEAGDIAQVVKGSEFMSKAIANGHNWERGIVDAVDAGVPEATLTKGLGILDKEGVAPLDAISAPGLIRRLTSMGMRAGGVGVKTAETAGRTAQLAINAGFSAQALVGAAEGYPKVLDALKAGDTDKAIEYATEAIGSGALGAFGAHHTISEAGSLVPDIEAAVGLRVKPTEENQKLRAEFGQGTAESREASQRAMIWVEKQRKDFKDLNNSVDGRRVLNLVEAGLDKDLMAKRQADLAGAANLTTGGEALPGPALNYAEAHAQAAEHFTNPETDGKYLYHGSDDSLKSVPAGANLSHDPKIALDHGANVYAVLRSELEDPAKGKEVVPGTHYAARVDHRSVNVTDAVRAPEDSIASPSTNVPGPRQNSEQRNQQLIEQQKLANSKNYTPAELKSLIDSYDPSKVTDRHIELAKIIQEKFNDTLAFGQDKGILKEGVDNYLTHKWGPDADNEANNELRHDFQRGAFSQNTTMARHRVFANSTEGELLGRKLAVADPLALAAHNEAEFGSVAANRDTLARIKDKGFRASDGAPMVALSGKGSFSPGDDSHGPAMFLDSHNMSNIRIAQPEIDRLTKSGDLDRFLESGRLVDITRKFTQKNLGADIERLTNKATNSNQTKFDAEGNIPIREQIRQLQGVKDGQLPLSTLDELNAAEKKAYAWDPHDYAQIDHPAMRGWQMVASTPDGTSGMLNGDLRAHPEAAEYIKRQLGVDRSKIGQSVIGKAVLGAGSEAKSLLLAFSPFHIAQEGLRAVMSGISPFGIERWDPSDMKLQNGIRQGLTLGKDYGKVEDFQEGVAGHSKILGKIPIAGRINDAVHDFLFDKYIPNLKARAYSALYNRYEASYPEWTPDKVAAEAAADTNSRFGGINTKDMGRSAATTDAARLVALAPDWLESELRFYGRAFGGNGKIARQDLARMAAYTWAASRVLNYVLTGKPHNEAPFGVATTGGDGKEHVVSVRTLPSDLIHAASDPVGFLKGRTAPLLKAGIQAYTGTDQYGRKLPEHAMFANLLAGTLQSASPIGIQSFVQQHTGVAPETSNIEQAEKAAGLTVMPYRTQASLLVSKLASNRAPNGPVDQALVGRHQAVMAIEQQIRTGQMPVTDLHKMVDEGTIDQKDGRTISKNIQLTHGMDPETADFFSKASRLDPASMLQVYDAATDNEKQVMVPLMDKARKSIFKKAMKEMTPKERASNPTYQRFRQMYPQFAPYE